MYHIPIMPSELSQLAVKNPNGLYIDATFGGGGHSLYLIEKYKDIKIIAFDCDAASFENFKNNESLFDGRVIFIRENFKNIAVSLSGIKVKKVDGIFADLGVSSKQFDDLSRGFSFNSPVLDMRMDERISLTAEELVNTYPPQVLADIFYKYGEEYRSRQIAQSIANRRVKRRLKSAADLCAAVEEAKKREGATHPATKVFQALRIFINGELENLEIFLKEIPSLLNQNGTVSVFTFHSLEDRIVKENFKNASKENIYKLLNKKVITPSLDEIRKNPRARSAKLRGAEKL